MTPEFKQGDRIKLLAMPEEPDPLADPATGTVRVARDNGDWVQYLVDWDSPNASRSLMPVCPPDTLQILERG